MIARIVCSLLVASAGALLLIHYTGVVAQKSEEVGLLSQQTDQLQQTVVDVQKDLKLQIEKRKTAEEQARSRSIALDENVQQVGRQQAIIDRLVQENEELQNWAAYPHPDSVPGVLQSASVASEGYYENPIRADPSSRGVD